MGRWVGGSVDRWVSGSVGRWIGGSVGRWVSGPWSVVGWSVGRWSVDLIKPSRKLLYFGCLNSIIFAIKLETETCWELSVNLRNSFIFLESQPVVVFKKSNVFNNR